MAAIQGQAWFLELTPPTIFVTFTFESPAPHLQVAAALTCSSLSNPKVVIPTHYCIKEGYCQVKSYLESGFSQLSQSISVSCGTLKISDVHIIVEKNRNGSKILVIFIRRFIVND